MVRRRLAPEAKSLAPLLRRFQAPTPVGEFERRVERGIFREALLGTLEYWAQNKCVGDSIPGSIGLHEFRGGEHHVAILVERLARRLLAVGQFRIVDRMW